MTLTLKIGKKKSACQSGLWCCITIPSFVTKHSVVQKISSRQTFTGILNLCCDLDLECSNPNIPQNTLCYNAVLANQVWLQTDQQFRRYTRNSNNFLLYKPSLWPWHWTQWTNFSAWHFGLWCCITIPGLVTKCSLGQKISSGQTFTDILNVCCDLDLECSNPIFQQGTLASDAVLSNQVWLQTDQQFRWYSRNNHILII